MHQDPEHSDYDDDDYNYYPEYNDYGYPYSKKFDLNWAAWEEWLSDAIKEIANKKDNVWVFGGYKPLSKKENSTSKKLDDKYFMYLGNNNYEEAIWKSKYFGNSKLNQMYKNYLSSNAAYFLRQPSYYKGMFDFLN